MTVTQSQLFFGISGLIIVGYGLGRLHSHLQNKNDNNVQEESLANASGKPFPESRRPPKPTTVCSIPAGAFSKGWVWDISLQKWCCHWWKQNGETGKICV